jgi:hypothetical protein
MEAVEENKMVRNTEKTYNDIADVFSVGEVVEKEEKLPVSL